MVKVRKNSDFFLSKPNSIVANFNIFSTDTELFVSEHITEPTFFYSLKKFVVLNR